MADLCEYCGEAEASDDEPCDQCRRELRCHQCDGAGTYMERRNSEGKLDYLHGEPTKRVQCSLCEGRGWRA